MFSSKKLISIFSKNTIREQISSTGAYIMGFKKSIELIESINGIEAIFITEDRKVYTTSGIKDKFKVSKEFSNEK